MKKPNNKIAKALTQNETKVFLQEFRYDHSPKQIVAKAGKDIRNMVNGSRKSDKRNITQAMTLYEFNNAGLLAPAVSKNYRTFVTRLSLDLQKEFGCVKESEKSIAHITSLNYVRILEIQTKITNYLGKGEVTNIGVGYLNVMSKELDRAERHYLTSLQALRMLKMPPLKVNIISQTAIVGQNQVIQSKNENNKAI